MSNGDNGNSLAVAQGLVALGMPVFKVRLGADMTKTPLHENGHLDATLDPGLVADWFIENPSAKVGVYVGAAGVIALDVDTKNGVDGWASLDEHWLEVPETFGYNTPTGGRHLIYTPPEGFVGAPSAKYRGMPGIDIRAGSSWVLWNGPAPASRDEFKPAPEWMLDEKTATTTEGFEGEVKEWYETLEPGTPSLAVRRAIERINDDMSHSDMVAATYEAIRLGSEGYAGVPSLIEALEQAWMSRDPGNHTTPEEKWDWKFHEALTSGIEKAGEAIALRKNLPRYDLSKVPNSVPDRLLTGAPGDKGVFRELLASLLSVSSDDLFVTSVLWNSPRTTDLAHEWGLEFTYKRVLDARETPEPVRENPAHEAKKKSQKKAATSGYLTDDEREIVDNHTTFIDTYLEASQSKGFTNPTYAVPSAWTALSMACGTRGIIPLSKDIGVNLWFLVMGYSSTGKSTSDHFLRQVLDGFLKGHETNYSLSASSSAEATHEALLYRDGLPTVIHHDEASDYFRQIQSQDWMRVVPDKHSKWYEGYVEPEQKVRLKELRGKSAHTSFNVHMMGTPDRLMSFLDLSMYQQGYLARMNFIWGDPSADPDAKYGIRLTQGRKTAGTPEEILYLSYDLAHLRYTFAEQVVMSAAPEVQARINQAHREFDAVAKGHSRYDKGLYSAVDRLGMETMWKCAFLLAMYEGRKEVLMEDALTAISHAEVWFETTLRVADNISESPYSRDVEEMLGYIRSEGGSVTRANLLFAFRGLIVKSQRELDDRIGFMTESGRVLRVPTEDGSVRYVLNES